MCVTLTTHACSKHKKSVQHHARTSKKCKLWENYSVFTLTMKAILKLLAVPFFKVI